MTSNLNPNASPFTATSPAKLISSPPPLLPHQFYFPSSPTKLLLPPPASDNISPIIISSDVSPITLAAVVHYPDHHHYIYYYYFYYLHRHTLPAANCHGGYEISTPDGHHAVPDPPPPCFQLVEHEAGSPEAVVKQRMVVKKRKVLKRKKNMVITRRHGGGADDWKSSDESKKPAGGGYITRRRGGGADDWKASEESKKTAAASAGGGDDQKEVAAAAAATITSLMIRHIPNHFQRYNMLRYLDGHCAAENSYAGGGGVISEYDFFYLPIDFRTGLNLGYAFVNFTTAVAAARFRRAFDNYNWKVRDSGKICQVTAAAIQGRDSLVENFSNSRFRCHRDSYLPAVFIPPRGGGRKAELKIVGERITPVPAVKLIRPNGIYSPRKSNSIRIK